jgi:hypothetical protein
VRPETKRAFHFGVNFLFAPPPNFTPGHQLAFQQRLAEDAHIVFDQTQQSGGKLVLVRAKKPLQVTVGPAGPQVAQLLVVAPEPDRLLSEFKDEARAVVEAYWEVWPGPAQIVRRDCTIRYLFVSEEEHAFKYLWEKRLGQSEEDLEALERDVLGGGLRLVMPRRTEVSGDPTVEVKVESFLRDSTHLFVDTQFVWEEPSPRGEEPNPGEMLDEVDEYAVGPVVKFITRED